jgi:hypothetical protein
MLTRGIFFTFCLFVRVDVSGSCDNGQNTEKIATDFDAQKARSFAVTGKLLEPAIVQRAFESIKPCNTSFEKAHESLEEFFKKHTTDEALIALRKLFPSNDSAFIKVLALQAECEKFHEFSALLYDTALALRLSQYCSSSEAQFGYLLFAIFTGYFLGAGLAQKLG